MEKVWYKRPAKSWHEALPLGNGFMGMMVYGGKKSETLCFNEGTLWSGYPKDYNSPESLENLERVRELVFSGKNAEADALAEEKLKGFYSEAFMPLGTVKLDFGGIGARGFSRELDLSRAVHTVKTADAVRTCFVSNPDRIAVYRIESEKPFNMTVTLHSDLKSEALSESGALELRGNAPDYAAPKYLGRVPDPIKYNEGKGMAFCLRTEIETDGKLTFSGGSARVEGAKSTVLFFAAETGFQGFNKMPDISRENASKKCRERLLAAGKNYEELKKRHTEDFSALYGREKISLGGGSDKPTDAIIRRVKLGGEMRTLSELLYNFGKYMTVSASRPGGQAMNLQGIWNNSMRPPWSSNYTVNINTQMNYWGAGRANLTQCIEPLISMVYECLETGRKTAEINYGCRGFACNHNVDLWRKTPPVEGSSSYMLAPLCGVWLANEIYTHYKNGGLAEHKARILEIVQEAAQFASDYLVLHDGFYVICPSASPENIFLRGVKACSLDYASAFDMSLVRQAFKNYLDFADDGELKAEIEKKLPLLYPYKETNIGIAEWHDKLTAPEKGHRHFSPLYGFYPGNVIKYYENPRETALVEKLFRHRLKHSGQHIGWSAAWAICLSAGLHDGETALKVIGSLLKHAVFKNLFCVHPPRLFQIDGNLGFIAGINEMLVYEENGTLDLLPALPAKWSSGSVRNMLINSAQISFEWQNGRITSLSSDMPIKIKKNKLSEFAEISENITVED